MIEHRTSAAAGAGLLLLQALVLSPMVAAAPMTEDERERLLEHLQRTRQMFLAAVDGLSKAQWGYKPAPERWSIAECAEHIAASERFIREAVAGFLQTPATPEELAATPPKEDLVLGFVTDRSQRFQSPEPVRPSHEWPTMEETLLAFGRERAETFKLVHDAEDLRAHAGDHPAVGPLDAYGWLFFLSGHSERHVQQIEEVKADSAFPKE